MVSLRLRRGCATDHGGGLERLSFGVHSLLVGSMPATMYSLRGPRAVKPVSQPHFSGRVPACSAPSRTPPTRSAMRNERWLAGFHGVVAPLDRFRQPSDLAVLGVIVGATARDDVVRGTAAIHLGDFHEPRGLARYFFI